MKKTIFTGAGVALVTPMNADGSVNYDELGKLIDFNINNGTDSIVVCGTSGESATLSHEEHNKAIDYTVKKVAGRVPVVAGTGSNDTKTALELSVEAQKMGADALLLVTPYYNKTTQQGLIAHYTYIADRVDIPIIVYNIPSRTGVTVKPQTFLELSKHPNIVAAKEASGNISAIAETAALCGDNLDIYSGNDDQIVPILSLGGKGVISVLSNVMPREAHDICEKFFKGDVEGSRKLQLELLPFIKALFCEVNPTPVKEALNMMGMNAGVCRLPLVELAPENKELLKKELVHAGLIK